MSDVYLRKHNGDICPAGKICVAGFLLPDDNPQVPRIEHNPKDGGDVVCMELCFRCPNRSTIWENAPKGRFTVRCQWEGDA